jgi:hypothetical protein
MSIFPTKILLDTHSSQNAQLARTTAVDMATTTDSELHLVSVAPSLPPTTAITATTSGSRKW